MPLVLGAIAIEGPVLGQSVTSIAAGESFTLIVKSDRTLWAAGRNSSGQLGDGSTLSRNVPVQVATGVVAATAGGYHSIFIKDDGTLWCAGSNSYGQLGDATTTARSTPVQVAGGVTAASAGLYHTVYLKTDGTLWAVGRNDYGQLGDGGVTSNRSTPVQVTSGVVAVTTGNWHTMYIKSDGTLWAMGLNNYGQLGDGSTTNRGSPVQVASGVAAAAAGGHYSAFVKTDGSLWTVGINTYGRLGDGTTTNRTSPAQVATGVRAVAAGSAHLMFVKADNSLWAAGRNNFGQLGDRTTTDQTAPVPVMTRVSAVAAGANHTLIIKTDGTLWAAGADDNGQLGLGLVSFRTRPVPVASNVATVVFGSGHTAFTKNDGTLWTMGDNMYGEVGDGTTASRSRPMQLASSVSSVALGSMHTAFVKADGTLWAVGNNGNGQLGDGTGGSGATRTTPVQVASGVSSVAAYSATTQFVKTDGTLWGMGYNSNGMLGDGTTTQRITPVQAATTGISPGAVEQGSGFTLLLKGDGSLWGMGSNQFGQLGDGTITSPRRSPIQTATGVASVKAGQNYTVFLKTDGTLWATGHNLYGQLGDGTNTNRTTPAQIAAGVQAYSAGQYHTAFIKADGTLWTMGRNNYGQLGDGSKTDRNVPVQVATGVASVVASGSCTMFVKAGGTLWATGQNSYGQLGDGTTIDLTTPTQVGMGVASVVSSGSHTMFIRTDGTLWAVGQNENGELGDGAAIFHSTPVLIAGTIPFDFDLWTWRSPLPNGNQFEGVAWNASTYVVVGVKGTIATSPTGSTWLNRASGTLNDLRDIAWNGSVFVAVGVSGTILTSPDGTTWTARASGSSHPLNGVVWNGTKFVVVGGSGTVLTSPDGTTWSTATSGTTDDLNDVAWSGNQFATVGANGRILASADGMAWSTRSSGVSNALQGVAWGNNQFVAVGQGGAILTSANGDSWISQTSGTTDNLEGIACSGTTFIAAGDNRRILRSTNGATWTSVGSGGHHLKAAIWGGGSFVLVGAGGTVMRSSDSVDWVVGNSALTGSYSGVAWNQSVFVTVGDAGRIRTSPDGVTWTLRTSGTSLNLRSVVWNGNLFVTVGSSAGGSSALRTSPDGVTWTGRASGTTTSLEDIVWTGTQFVVVGTSGTIVGSLDGITWSTRTSGTTQPLYGVSSNGVQIVAVGSAGTILTSPDGSTWTSRRSGTEELRSVTWAGTQFVAAGTSGTILTSVDGLTWTNRPTGITANLNKVVRIGGRLVALGSGGTIATSDDGISWTIRNSGTANGLMDIVSTGDQLVAVGEFNTILTATENQVPLLPTIADQPFSRRAVAGGDVLFCVGANGAGTLTYQWRKGGVPITGATQSELRLNRVSQADAGNYDVVIANGAGAITSSATVLAVLAPDNVPWQQFTDVPSTARWRAPSRLLHDGQGKVYAMWSAWFRDPDVVGGRFAGAIVRLNESDGSLDPGFRVDSRFRRFSPGVITSDGKLVVAADNAGDSNVVMRLTATGAVDPTFSAPLFARTVRFVSLYTGGKLLIAATEGVSPANPAAGAIGAGDYAIYRLNPDGSLDQTFTPATLGGMVGPSLAAPPVVDSAGRIYLAGMFSTVNGTSRSGMARLTPDGALDATYATPSTFPAGFTSPAVRAVALQGDGRAIFVGRFRYTTRGTADDAIMAVRFSTEGAFDTTFAQPLRSELGIGQYCYPRYLIIEADDRIVAVSDRLIRLHPNGSRDPTFVSRAFDRESFWLTKGADGRYYVPDQEAVAGNSVTIPNWGNSLSRFNNDGTPDFGLQTGGWGRIDYPTAGAILSDGRIWLAGDFNRYGSTYAPGVVQLSAVGAPTPTQASSAGSYVVGTLAPAGGDRIFVRSSTTIYSEETPTASLVRLNANGSLDPAFNAAFVGGESCGLSAVPDGRLMIFETGSASAEDAINGNITNALVRLNGDGSRDTGYAPNLSAFAKVDRGADNAITKIGLGLMSVTDVLPDGSVLLAVASHDGNARVQRLTPMGSIDTTFNPPSFGATTVVDGWTPTVFDPVTGTTAQRPVAMASSFTRVIRAALQLPDGKVYVGGSFALPGSVRGLSRLMADGSLDTSFTGIGISHTKPGIAPFVAALAVDAAGRVYVGGRFDRYNGIAVPGLFRLNADGTLDAGWSPGFGVLDAPEVALRFVIRGGKLYAFGTVGNPADVLPSTYCIADIATPPATIAAVSPTTAAPGMTVTITGAHFTGATAVRFNGVDATFFTVVSATVITAVVPPLATSGAVTVSTPGGTSAAGPALAIVSETAATHAVVGAGYVAGFNVKVANILTYAGGASELTWDVLLPAGWSFAANAGALGEGRPTPGATGTIRWTWTNPTPGEIAFTYTLAVPFEAAGSHEIDGLVTVHKVDGSLTQILVKPDPLIVQAGGTHAADTDRNFRIDLVELTRVIELYNTRNGTVRTGAYKVQSETEDGFAPDPIRLISATGALSRYHSADSRGAPPGVVHDGMLDLMELTRIIELYNCRSGTMRTGQYHVKTGTEDGFAPGPAP